MEVRPLELPAGMHPFSGWVVKQSDGHSIVPIRHDYVSRVTLTLELLPVHLECMDAWYAPVRREWVRERPSEMFYNQLSAGPGGLSYTAGICNNFADNRMIKCTD